MQLDIFAPPPMARRSDPVTSHQAAASDRELQQRDHRMIVECLRAHGPLGKDGIAERINRPGHAIGKRMSELEAMGLVRATGRTVKSASGRAEPEWEAV